MIKKYLILVLLFFLIFLGLGTYLYFQIPTPEEIRGCLTTKLYKVYLCPTSNNYTHLKSISNYFQKSVVLTEDSNFWNHQGFDWESIEKSARENWEKGEYKRGGSTITQQLAKNMFLSKDKSLIRKGLEAIITDRIEKTLKKKEILEKYLNVIEFGKDIYGIKAASSFYFKKAPSELNVAESAFLTMLLPSPIKYSKSFYKKSLSPFARKRMTQIISSLFKYERISQTEYDIAMTQVDNFYHNNTEVTETPPDVENEIEEEDP